MLGEDEHPAPGAGCRCGVYAYRTPELARPLGPGLWVYGQVLVGGPMFLTDNGYRGREVVIDGPLALVMECGGGDDLFSPVRCFGEPTVIRYDLQSYYPLCSSHRRGSPEGRIGNFSVEAFVDAVACLAIQLETRLVVPASA
jgi:hypothetical protein